jgi:predicted cupin superfamily sugar epimerase
VSETFRDIKSPEGRAYSTAIYFLLKRGEQSRTHRVDAVEIWHFHAGAPLALTIHDHRGKAGKHVLGIDLKKGQQPQIVVPARAWQSARTQGAYTLVSCTVAPGFEFAGFEISAADRSSAKATAPAGAKRRSPRSRARN